MLKLLKKIFLEWRRTENMDIENIEGIGRILKALSGEKRLAAFELIAAGKELKTVSEEIEISRSGLQNYVDDFREEGLIEKKSGSYELAEKGEEIRQWVKELDERYDDLLYRDAKRGLNDQGIGYDSPKGREILKRLLEESEQNE